MNLQYRDDGTFSVEGLDLFRLGGESLKGHAKVIVFREEDGGCWRCISHLSKHHARTSVSAEEDYTRIMRRAVKPSSGFQSTSLPNFMFEFIHGKKPKGLCILHRCDNAWCCNPTHLYTGTKQDNNRDRASRNRESFEHYNTRLTVEDVMFIRDNPKVSNFRMAEVIGCGILAVLRVRNGHFYRTYAFEKDSVTGKMHRVPLPDGYFFGQEKSNQWDPTENVRHPYRSKNNGENFLDKSMYMDYINM